MNKTTRSKIEQEQLERINNDPVLWAKSHIITYDQVQKKFVPWTARWCVTMPVRYELRENTYFESAIRSQAWRR